MGPDDWDDEDDGEWEAPMIDNPDYKGAWVHPKIPNPEYEYDEEMYAVCKGGCTHVGFELCQVKSGTVFDDIFITDSLEEAQQFAEESFFKKKEGEKKMYDDIQAKKDAEAQADMDDDMDEGMYDDSMYDDMDMGDEF